MLRLLPITPTAKHFNRGKPEKQSRHIANLTANPNDCSDTYANASASYVPSSAYEGDRHAVIHFESGTKVPAGKTIGLCISRWCQLRKQHF